MTLSPSSVNTPSNSITRGELTLPLILTRAERLRAHLEIHRIVRACQWDRQQISNPYDARLAAIFTLDPSLLIESIPEKSPLNTLGPAPASMPASMPASINPWDYETSGRDDATDVEWHYASRTYKCWLTRLSDFNLNLKDCIVVGLKAGASPLDTELFYGNKSLFDKAGWSQNLEKLAIGLEYLAALPENSEIKAFKSELLRHCLMRVLPMIGDTKVNTETILSAFECVELCAKHGAVYELTAIETKGGMPSKFSSLCASSVDAYDEEVQAAYRRCLSTLLLAGAGIDEETGPWNRAPLIHAIYGDSCLGISTLIELGCEYSRLQINKDVYVIDIVKHSRESTQQPATTAALVEAIMKLRIKEILVTPVAQTESDNTSETLPVQSVSSKAKRRLSV